MKNNISDLAPKKNFIQKVKDIWNEEKPTEQEIIVSKMMSVLFSGQTTEQVIDTLLLFDEKAKAKLKAIQDQAEKDRFVTDFYLGTSNKSKKVSI